MYIRDNFVEFYKDRNGLIAANIIWDGVRLDKHTQIIHTEDTTSFHLYLGTLNGIETVLSEHGWILKREGSYKRLYENNSRVIAIYELEKYMWSLYLPRK
jgi:hypothetical protein